MGIYPKSILIFDEYNYYTLFNFFKTIFFSYLSKFCTVNDIAIISSFDKLQFLCFFNFILFSKRFTLYRIFLVFYISFLNFQHWIETINREGINFLFFNFYFSGYSWLVSIVHNFFNIKHVFFIRGIRFLIYTKKSSYFLKKFLSRNNKYIIRFKKFLKPALSFRRLVSLKKFTGFKCGKRFWRIFYKKCKRWTKDINLGFITNEFTGLLRNKMWHKRWRWASCIKRKLSKLRLRWARCIRHKLSKFKSYRLLLKKKKRSQKIKSLKKIQFWNRDNSKINKLSKFKYK